MGEPTEISDAELEASEKYLRGLTDAEWTPRDVDEAGNCWEWELRPANGGRLIVGPAERAYLAAVAKSASDVLAALRSTREREKARGVRIARTEAECDTLTTPTGSPWRQRSLSSEHVERLRELHMCAGYDCQTCILIATVDSVRHSAAAAAGHMLFHAEEDHCIRCRELCTAFAHPTTEEPTE